MKLSPPPALSALWKDPRRRANLLVGVGVAGMLLLALPELVPARGQTNASQPPPQAQTDPTADYGAMLEQRLQTLLGNVQGVGQVQVMVTVASGEQTVYAQDLQTAADGASQQSHVLLSGSEEPALVETVCLPALQGVAVVCQGGGDAAVQSRVTDIVRALTGLGASHITVTPMVTTNRGEA